METRNKMLFFHNILHKYASRNFSFDLRGHSQVLRLRLPPWKHHLECPSLHSCSWRGNLKSVFSTFPPADCPSSTFLVAESLISASMRNLPRRCDVNGLPRGIRVSWALSVPATCCVTRNSEEMNVVKTGRKNVLGRRIWTAWETEECCRMKQLSGPLKH